MHRAGSEYCGISMNLPRVIINRELGD